MASISEHSELRDIVDQMAAATNRVVVAMGSQQVQFPAKGLQAAYKKWSSACAKALDEAKTATP